MENNRLNINRPLLSVRRRTSLLSGERKNESYVAVKPAKESCTNGSTPDALMNTGSVPFVWENSPGRPKDEQIQTVEIPPALPKLPPGRVLEPVKNDSVASVSKITKYESMESTKKESIDSRYVVNAATATVTATATAAADDDDDEDNDEAYEDALDTLSRGETSFYNCSASGVSGFGSDVKPSRFVPADPKTKDFMMGRFLPAAKAMASDLPQQTFKKDFVKEKPQEVKRLVNIDHNSKMKLRYGPNFLQDVTQDNEDDDDDGDDDESEYDYSEHGNKSSKFCGLIPRFCSSNPVYGMCVRGRLPVSPAKRTQTSSSSSNSFRETDSEPARNATYKHRSLNSALKNESTEISNLEGIKLYNRLQGNGSSTASEQSDSSSKKKGVSFKEVPSDKNTNETETDIQDSIIEKTLYVDTFQIVKSPQENPLPSSTKPQPIFNEPLKSDMLADESKHDLETEQYKDPEVGLEVIDDISINKQLKASEKVSETRVFELPAPPPLPKSPSDSWLGRTLPSVSSRNTHMRWNQKYPSSNTFASDPKSDEKIRLHKSLGQLNPIPES